MNRPLLKILNFSKQTEFRKRFSNWKVVFLLLLCLGCAPRQQGEEALSSVQIIDRNGFSETVSVKDRIEAYEKKDFLSNQPYQKVLRVYGKGSDGSVISKITTYHPNGQIWQYLETKNGRAFGLFKEWHENGKLHVEAKVIEGIADLTEQAQLSWLFDGMSYVWDEEGHRIAEIPYEKGLLSGEAHYYFPEGGLWKKIPYLKDGVEGTVLIFNAEGDVIEKIAYQRDVKHGLAEGPTYREQYREGLLMEGIYTNPSGLKLSEVIHGDGLKTVFQEGYLQKVITFKNGEVEGKVEEYQRDGSLKLTYHLKDGKKHGEEIAYYPSVKGKEKPKLQLNWIEDTIQGVVKTWYPDGSIESQREMHGNKKHGLAFAWYDDGSLMLTEEYADDLLQRGSYFKKGDPSPVSKIENGKGVATLHTAEGYFFKTVPYDKGVPFS